MNITIQITSKEEAQEAVNMLQGYLGNSSISTVAAKVVETKEDVKAEEPKKVTKPKTTTKPKVEKEVPAEEPEVEDETAGEVEEKEASDIDLKALTGIAKKAVERTDRMAAKKVISKYGTKLSEVDEADYSALAADLEALGE
ncbi:hypothetical protein [Sulfurimonas sp.]|uniref:hypothetical protein n=1 Tax=Sulfurimonas sp. TaxID=2022749 RepID=UPI0035679676